MTPARFAGFSAPKLTRAGVTLHGPSEARPAEFGGVPRGAGGALPLPALPALLSSASLGSRAPFGSSRDDREVVGVGAGGSALGMRFDGLGARALAVVRQAGLDPRDLAPGPSGLGAFRRAGETVWGRVRSQGKPETSRGPSWAGGAGRPGRSVAET